MSKSPTSYFEDLSSSGGKDTPEVGGGEAGLPRDPCYGGICLRGPRLGACRAPPPSPKAGRVARLSRGAQRPAKLAPRHLPCRVCRERRVFNEADCYRSGTQTSARVGEPSLVSVGPEQDLGSPCERGLAPRGTEAVAPVRRALPRRSRNIWEVRGSLTGLQP